MKCSIWDEKSTNCYPNQDQKLKEPEPEKEIFSNPISTTDGFNFPSPVPPKKQAELPPSINVELSHDQAVTRFEQRHVGLCCYEHQP